MSLPLKRQRESCIPAELSLKIFCRWSKIADVEKGRGACCFLTDDRDAVKLKARASVVMYQSLNNRYSDVG